MLQSLLCNIYNNKYLGNKIGKKYQVTQVRTN